MKIKITNKINQVIKSFIPLRWLAIKYIEKINLNEYLKPTFTKQNERPVEYRFVFEQISKFYPKSILDVGSGITALPHLMANCGCKVTAIDNIKDYWPKGMSNRHYYITNDDITHSKLFEKFDMVTSVSTLEHIVEIDLAIKEMFRLTNDNGYVVMTFPYNEKTGVDNVYSLKGSNVKTIPHFKTRAYSRNDLQRWEKENNATVVDQEYWQFFNGNYWTIGEMVLPPKKVTSDKLHQISCVIFKKNK